MIRWSIAYPRRIIDDPSIRVLHRSLVCVREKCHTELSLLAMTIGVLILPSFCDWMQHWPGILASTSFVNNVPLGQVLLTTPKLV